MPPESRAPRALPVDKLTQIMAEGLDDEMLVLGSMIQALGRGELPAELWGQMHQAAQRDDRLLELAAAYDEATKPIMLRRMPAAVQAEVLFQAGEFQREALEDAEGAEAYYERAVAADGSHRVAFDQLEALLIESGNGLRLVELYQAAAGQPSGRDDQRRLLRRALELAEVFGEAAGKRVALGERLLKLDPLDPEVRRQLEGLYRESGRWSELARMLEQPTPDEDEAARRSKLVDLYLGELTLPDRAVGHVEELLRLDPSSAVGRDGARRLASHRMLGVRAALALEGALASTGQTEEQAQVLAAAIEQMRGPQRTEAQRRLGRALLALGRDDEAFTALEKATSVDAGDEESRRQFRQVGASLGRSADVARVLQRAAATARGDALKGRLQLEAGEALLSLGDGKRARAALQAASESADEGVRDEALERLEQAVGGEPRALAEVRERRAALAPGGEARARALVGVAEAWEAAGDEGRALEAWRQATAAGAPGSASTLEARLEQAGAWAELVARLEQPAEGSERAERAASLRAGVLGDAAGALAAWEQVIARHGATPGRRQARRDLLERLGRRAELAEALAADASVAEEPAEAAALWGQLARVALASGASGEALAAVQRALALAPGQPQAAAAATALLGAEATGLAAARALLPLYREQADYWGLVRALEVLGSGAPAADERLAALAEAIDLVATDDPGRALGLARTGLGVAVDELPEALPDWLVRMELLSSAAGGPAEYAATLLGALGERAIEGPRVDLARRAAEALLEGGEAERGLGLLERVFVAEPARAREASGADRALAARGDTASRARLWRLVAAHEPEAARRAEALRRLAGLERQRGHEDAALEALRQAGAAAPQDAGQQRELIEALRRAGRGDELAAALVQLASLVEGDERPALWRELAPLASSLGQHQRAAEAYGELLVAGALPPDELLGAEQAAKAAEDLALTGRIQRARVAAAAAGDVNQARSLGADPALSAQALPALRAAAEGDEAALAALETFLRVAPRDEAWRQARRWSLGRRARHGSDRAAALLAWARAEEDELGDAAAAVAVYRQLLEVDPDQATAAERLVALLEAQGDREGVRVALLAQRARASGERRRQLDRELAALLAGDHQRHDEALALLEALLEEQPRDGATLEVAARLLEDDGADEAIRGGAADAIERGAQADDAEAAAWFERLLRSSVGDEATRWRWYGARLRQLDGDDEAALAVALRAVDEAPRAVERWEQAELRARRLGRPGPVLEAYRRHLADAAVVAAAGQRAIDFQEEWGDDREGVAALLERILVADVGAQWAFDRLKVFYGADERWGDLLGLYDRMIEAARSDADRAVFLEDALQIARDFAGDDARAVVYVERLLALRPGDGALRGALDRLSERLLGAFQRPPLDGPRPADVYLRAAARLKPRYEQGERHAELARVLEIELLGASAAERPDALRRLIALRLGSLGDVAGAFDDTMTLLALRPGDEPARRQALELAERAGTHARLAAALEALAADGADAATAATLWLEAARLADRRLGEPARAEADYRHALALGRQADGPLALAAARELTALLVARASEPALRHDALADQAALEPTAAERQPVLAAMARVARDELHDPGRQAHACRLRLADAADDRSALDGLIEACERLGRWDELVATLERRAQLAGGEPGDDLRRAARVRYDRQGDREGALALWTARRQLLGDDEESIDAIIALLDETDRLDELAQLLTAQARAATAPRRAAALRARLGATEQRRQRPDQAIDAYAHALRDDPASAEALAGLVGLAAAEASRPAALAALLLHHRAQEDWSAVVDLLELRLSLAPDAAARAAILRETARLQRDQGEDPTDALSTLRRALQSTPADLSLVDEIEATARAAHWPDEALVALREAARDPRAAAVARTIWLVLAAALTDRDGPGAEEAYEQAMAAGDEVALLRPLVALRRRHPDDALPATLLRLAAVDPGHAPALRVEAGQWELASPDGGPRARAIAELILEQAALGTDDWASHLPAVEWALTTLLDPGPAQLPAAGQLAVLERAPALPFEPDRQAELLRRGALLAGESLDTGPRAIALWHRLLALAPRDLSALGHLAQLHRALGQPDALREVLERQIATDERPAARAPLRLELARLLTAADRRPDAIATLEAALTEAPDEPEVARQLEALYEACDRPRELATLLSAQAARHEDDAPDQVRSWWVRAAALAEQPLDDLPLAEHARRRAAALGDRASRSVLAALLRRRGAHDEAARELERVVADATGDELTEALRQLAEAHHASGRGEEARRTLERALEGATDLPPLQARLAELYREASDWPRLASLMETEARAMGDERARGARLREAAELLLGLQNDAARAAALLEEAAALGPDDAGTLLLLGESLRRAGKPAEATAALRRLVEAYGARRPRERALAHLQLALALRDGGDGAAALAELDIAARIDPAHPRILQAIGQVASEQGETERAQKALRSLLLLLPRGGGRNEHGISRVEVQLGLSDLARRQGDEARADELIETAFAHARDGEGELPVLIEGLRARGLWAPLSRALEARLDATTGAEHRAALAELAALHERLGRTDEAAARLRQALDEADEAGRPPLLYALARLRLPSAPAEGLAALHEALALEPDLAQAASLLASAVAAHETDEQVLRAHEAFSRAHGRWPELIDALRRLGALPGASPQTTREAAELALETGAPEADDILRDLTALTPGPDADPVIHWALLTLADRQQARGDLSLAASLRERAAEGATGEERRSLRLEVAALAAGPLHDTERSVRLYQAVLADDPGDRLAWLPLLGLLRRAHDPARLVALLEQLLPVVDGAERPALRHELTELHLGDSPAARAARAAELLEDALADDPDDARAAGLLTALLERTGDAARLGAHLARRLDLACDRGDRAAATELGLRLGRLHEQQGDEPAALSAYQRALTGAPDEPALLRAALAIVERRDEAPELAELLEGLLASAQGPEAAELALRLAAIHEANWNPEGAGVALERGYALHPTPALRDQLAERYADAGEWSKLAALHGRDAAASEGPARVAALLRAAEVHHRRLAAPAAAADLLQQALALDPASAGALRGLLEALDAAPSPTSSRRALDALSLVLERRPGDGELRRLRGERHAALGSFDEAIADLDAASLAGDPAAAASLRSALEASLRAGGRPDALRPRRLRLAALLEAAGEADAARALLEASVRAEPTQPDVLRALANHERRAGRLSEALVPLRSLAAATEGDDLPALALELAELAATAGRLAEARPALERARAFAPSRRDVRESLRDLYERLGARREHALLLRDEAAFAPDAARRLETLLAAARLLLDPDQGDPRLAAQILDEARPLRPDDLDLALLQADVFLSLRRQRDALAALDQAVASQRGRRSRPLAALLQRKAQLELDLGERASALQSLTRAFESDSASGSLAVALGRLALEMNDEAIATRAFRAITLMKTSPTEGATSQDKAQAYYQLSLLALGQDDPRKARMLADKALHEDPTLAPARQLRDELKNA